jgi:pilus assembly protein Flp/PilA
VAGVLVQNAKVNVMKTLLKNFVADQSGASAAEYALILAIVGAGIAVAALALGGAITKHESTAAGLHHGDSVLRRVNSNFLIPILR